jgi:hypothetical protein
MRVLAALATLVAGAALACVAAYWGWQLLGPAAVRVPSSGPVNPAATIIAANLFGNDGSPTPNAIADPALGADTKLLGIITESGERGYALFRLPTVRNSSRRARDCARRDACVHSRRRDDSRRCGERRPVAQQRAAAGRAAVPAAAANVRMAAASTRATPSATRRPRISRHRRAAQRRIAGRRARIRFRRSVAVAIEGGLVVRSDNGFGAMLGLKTGDRLAQANGIALAAPDDVAAAIVRPLVANQGVRLIGARDGATQELWLANVACAG